MYLLYLKGTNEGPFEGPFVLLLSIATAIQIELYGKFQESISKSHYSHQDAPPGTPYITMGQQNACRVWSWRAGCQIYTCKVHFPALPI